MAGEKVTVSTTATNKSSSTRINAAPAGYVRRFFSCRPGIVFFLVGLLGQPTIAAELYLAFWNVENLFDNHDDPDVEGDEEFTPRGAKRWTSQRLERKLVNLARVIQQMNDRRGPDVLGLCEVENRLVLESLVVQLKSLSRPYDIIHKDSPSGRGIDCAILYDRGRMKLKSARFLAVDAATTRDIAEAEFTVDDKGFHFFANHWPSRYNPESARIAAAGTLRRRLDEILARDPSSDLVIMGDLNDTPTNGSVGKTLRTWSDPNSLHPGVFFNSMFQIHQDPSQGTYVYKNRWQVLDHVILSPGMLDQQAFTWKKDSTHVVRHDFQMFIPRDRRLLARPNRSYTGNNFHADGISDHLPVACVIQY